MTALAGFWSFEGAFDASRSCRAMLAAQAAYGVAESDVRLDGLALGRRSCPLLPEDRFDRQPLIGGEGRFALVADLRLDNRAELAGALAVAATEAATLADSDLLMRAVERWGAGAVDRLLGDFAFAIFDAVERKLVLARDPLGQRPLFWHRGRGFVAFASMPKGLHALEAVARRADATSLLSHLGGLTPEGPRSFYEGVSRVEPGHVMEFRPDGMSSRRYWTPVRRPLRLPKFEDYVAAYRDELDQAVARRLRGAEGIVATHLSGGWDSSAVTATAARLAPETRFVAYTAVPRRGAAASAPGARFADEGAHAAATAALYPNIEHIRIAGSARSPIADLDRYVEVFDRPMANLCNHVWLAGIRDSARVAGARILLTGEIGNWTISAGPHAILADYVSERRWAAWLREATAMAVQRRARIRGIAASSFAPWIPTPVWTRLRRLSAAPDDGLAPIHPRLRTTLARELSEREAERPPKSYFDSACEALSTMDPGEYRKGVLGGWGLDKRDATADRRLADFCLSLPIEMLMKDGERRPLARAALADRLPAAVLEERRKGYQAADWHEGLTNDLPAIRDLVEAFAASDEAASLLDVPTLRRWVDEWPEAGWDSPEVVARYRSALLSALSVGHFILSCSR